MMRQSVWSSRSVGIIPYAPYGLASLDLYRSNTCFDQYVSDIELGVTTHVGNLKLTMMPAGQGFVGNALVSGKRVLGSCRHVYVSCGYLSASALVDAIGEPMSIRKPGWNALTFAFC